MKKTAFLVLSIGALYLPAFASLSDASTQAKVEENAAQDLKVIPVSHLTEQDLTEVMQGNHPEVAIEFSAHTTLPISFYLKGDLIDLIETEKNFEQVEIKQTFYARCVGEELLLSSNLTEWKPFLEFITGNISIALVLKDGHLSMAFGSETNRRI